MVGNKLRKEPISLSLQFFGSQAATEVHQVLTENQTATVGSEIGMR